MSDSVVSNNNLPTEAPSLPERGGSPEPSSPPTEQARTEQAPPSTSGSGYVGPVFIGLPEELIDELDDLDERVMDEQFKERAGEPSSLAQATQDRETRHAELSQYWQAPASVQEESSRGD